jgi:WD40 repeat protein
LDREVAIKLLPAGEVDVGRLRREGVAAARLQHPNIVTLYEVGETAAGPYLAFEYQPGGSLADHLATAPLAPRQAAEWAEMIARAVAYAHERGVVHRDIKPANVLLGPGPKLTDFGLAKLADHASIGTEHGAVFGTPSYMAPEQAEAREAGPPADVYSVGAVLYECLTGRPPFRAETPLATLRQVVSADPVAPDRLQPGLPRDLSAVCLKCLEKDPARRYPSAGALADDLRRFLDGRPTIARPPGPGRRLVRWARRRPAVAALTAALILAGVGLAVGGVWTNTRLRAARDAAADSERYALEQKEYAQQQEGIVRRQFEAARRDAYTIRLGLVGEIWRDDPGRGLELLEDGENCPPPLRDFAWGMFHRLCRQGSVVLRPPRTPTVVGFSADGRAVVVRGSGPALAYDLPAGPWRPSDDPTSPTPAIAPGGRVRVQAAGPTGVPFTIKLPPGQAPDRLAASADGAWLALAHSADKARAVRVIDTSAGTVAAARDGTHLMAVGAVALSADGALVATGGQDRFVRVWSLPGMAERRAFRGHLGPVRSLAFAPDGTSLASAGEDGTVRVWPLADPEPDALDGNGHRLTGLAFAPGGETLYAVAADGALLAWPLPAGGPARTLARFPPGLFTIAVGPDGGRLAVGGDDKAVHLLDAAGAEVARLDGHNAIVRSLAFSPDGRQLASAAEAGPFRVWAVDRSGPDRVFDAPKSAPRSVSVNFTPDGRRLVVGEPSGRFTVVDADTLKPILFRDGHRGLLLFEQFSRDGRTLATGGLDFVVRLWDGETFAERMALPGHTEYVFAAALTPDGRTLATGSGNRLSDVPGEVQLWDVATGHRRGRLRDQTGPLAFSPDGNVLATVTDHKRVRLWRSGVTP